MKTLGSLYKTAYMPGLQPSTSLPLPRSPDLRGPSDHCCPGCYLPGRWPYNNLTELTADHSPSWRGLKARTDMGNDSSANFSEHPVLDFPVHFAGVDGGIRGLARQQNIGFPGHTRLQPADLF